MSGVKRRSHTCKSFIGFQSCSTKTTVSAPVKFSPSPPTCVVSNRISIDGSLLNLKRRKEKSRQLNTVFYPERLLFVSDQLNYYVESDCDQ